MDLFGGGPGELLLILVIALVVLGPERLPEVAGQVGRTVGELRRQAAQLTLELQRSLEPTGGEHPPPGSASGPPPTGPFCASCGARAAPEARYCSSCGARLAGPPTTGRPPA